MLRATHIERKRVTMKTTMFIAIKPTKAYHPTSHFLGKKWEPERSCKRYTIPTMAIVAKNDKRVVFPLPFVALIRPKPTINGLHIRRKTIRHSISLMPGK
jgi:hypothetical protein